MENFGCLIENIEDMLRSRDDEVVWRCYKFIEKYSDIIRYWMTAVKCNLGACCRYGSCC